MTGITTTAEFAKNKKLASDAKIAAGGWVRVLYAHDCEACDMCEEPVCARCEVHYADCDCPGPHQDDEYAYRTIDGVEYARRLENGIA